MPSGVERMCSVGLLPPRRHATQVTIVALALVLVAGGPAPAVAQTLFQSLFGMGGPPPSRIPPPQAYPLRTMPSPFGSPARGSFEPAPRTGGGDGYRTVCVRTCDGYYFLISNNVSRSQFTRDARSCQASCGSDARLFYQSAGESSAEHLVDLTGRSYSSLITAFRYRKSLVAGCSCKPAPWSEAELTRHQRYADAEAVANGRPVVPRPQQQIASVVAGGNDTAVAAEMTGRAAVAAPVIAGGGDPEPAKAAMATPLTAEAAEDGDVADAVAAPRARPKPIVVAQRAAPVVPPPPPRPGQTTTGTPIAAPAKAPRPTGGSALGGPVYSREQDRFLFPGEQRYR